MNDSQQGIVWLVVHIVLGALVPLYPMVVAGWLGCVLIAVVLYSIRDRNHAGMLHVAACYLCTYEMLARMAKTLPYESGRYLGIPLLVLGLGFGKKLSSLVPGIILLALITPSLIRTDYSRDIRDTLVFNWFGVLVLALSVMYFHRRVFA